MTRICRLATSMRVHLVHDRRGDHAAHVLRVAPDVRRLEDRELRHELAELRRALVDDLDRAGRRRLDHVARRAELAGRERSGSRPRRRFPPSPASPPAPSSPTAGMLGRQHGRPAQRGRCACPTRQRRGDGRRSSQRRAPCGASSASNRSCNSPPVASCRLARCDGAERIPRKIPGSSMESTDGRTRDQSSRAGREASSSFNCAPRLPASTICFPVTASTP